MASVSIATGVRPVRTESVVRGHSMAIARNAPLESSRRTDCQSPVFLPPSVTCVRLVPLASVESPAREILEDSVTRVRRDSTNPTTTTPSALPASRAPPASSASVAATQILEHVCRVPLEHSRNLLDPGTQCVIRASHAPTELVSGTAVTPLLEDSASVAKKASTSLESTTASNVSLVATAPLVTPASNVLRARSMKLLESNLLEDVPPAPKERTRAPQVLEAAKRVSHAQLVSTVSVASWVTPESARAAPTDSISMVLESASVASPVIAASIDRSAVAHLLANVRRAIRDSTRPLERPEIGTKNAVLVSSATHFPTEWVATKLRRLLPESARPAIIEHSTTIRSSPVCPAESVLAVSTDPRASANHLEDASLVLAASTF